jgi:hypothetical protein
MKTNANFNIVAQALATVNKKYDYRLEFNRADTTGKWFNFTIKSKSGIPGARLSCSGRKLAFASWHAHGYLFDEIFKLSENAVIYSASEKITKDRGNWRDINIGSIMSPCMLSGTSIL